MIPSLSIVSSGRMLGILWVEDNEGESGIIDDPNPSRTLRPPPSYSWWITQNWRRKSDLFHPAWLVVWIKLRKYEMRPTWLWHECDVTMKLEKFYFYYGRRLELEGRWRKHNASSSDHSPFSRNIIMERKWNDKQSRGLGWKERCHSTLEHIALLQSLLEKSVEKEWKTMEWVSEWVSSRLAGLGWSCLVCHAGRRLAGNWKPVTSSIIPIL